MTLFFGIKGCNKTYYGDIGRTYELELHRPREDLVPYICLLTITAAGGIHGDLVQVGKKNNMQYVLVTAI
ncbi:unnamed protein product [Euphydryas editha]|uniref:Uncharacterized protein n=1 Tax=Euphydryas editha TaxID=104508 RepID=A0AAU9TQ93_EUPED|nr:unnamed protein product [Euphydryas editha]